MDFDSSSKFISSLAKFLQSLCNGYVEFNSGVEVIGHIYLSVDTGKKIDYILNEKVCKTDENSVTFISNSFHAQPAEKPKLPAKAAQTSDLSKVSDAVAKSEDDIIIMEDPESKNVGTIPSRNNLQNFHQTNNAPLKAHRPSKRSFNQSFPYSSRNPAKHSRTNSVAGGGESHRLESESLPENNSSVTFLPQSLGEDTTLAPPSESEMSHLSKVFPQTFSDNVNSESVPEERDVKPQIDDDLEIVQVKQEYSHSNQGIEDQEGFDDSQDHSSYPSMPYDQYYSEGKKRGQRSDYSHLGGLSQAEYYQSGGGSVGGPAGDGSGGDSAEGPGGVLTKRSEKSRLAGESSSSSFPQAPNGAAKGTPPLAKIFHTCWCYYCDKGFDSDSLLVEHLATHTTKKPFKCDKCHLSFMHRSTLKRHQNVCGGSFTLKQYVCPFCVRSFTYRHDLRRHCRNIHVAEPDTLY